MQVFGSGQLALSLACLLTPIVARWAGAPGVIVIRVIQGLASGLSLPCCHVLFSKWAPVNERSSMMSLVFSGMYTGAVVSNLLSGIVAENYGWASIFYGFGTFGIVWCLVFVLPVLFCRVSQVNFFSYILGMVPYCQKISSR
jgi:MFS family permease